MNIEYIPKTVDLEIQISEPGDHYTLWNRLKTWIWNFILPPHIRLRIRKHE